MENGVKLVVGNVYSMSCDGKPYTLKPTKTGDNLRGVYFCPIGPYFNTDGYFGKDITYPWREATWEETEHLKQCIAAGKYEIF